MSFPRGDEYQARFDALAASGEDVHGEVDFVLGLEPPPATVLDAGCGTGRVAIELHRRGIEVVGTDVAADMLVTARSRAPELEWVEADLATIDLGRTFDAVVLAGNVLLFVEPGTQAEVVRRCGEHIGPTGVVVAGFSIRRGGYTTDDLDEHAAAAGLIVAERWATWDRQPWHEGGSYAVTVLRA
jgi:2-polyprenyl-3-methyl-5-hydroxy-6-metoxy-1,4-benzoquinol methylase